MQGLQLFLSQDCFHHLAGRESFVIIDQSYDFLLYLCQNVMGTLIGIALILQLALSSMDISTKLLGKCGGVVHSAITFHARISYQNTCSNPGCSISETPFCCTLWLGCLGLCHASGRPRQSSRLLLSGYLWSEPRNGSYVFFFLLYFLSDK